ncbi:putative 2-oxoglutarate-dependent dioxygenase SLC1 [Drosera capensis]
MEDNQLESLHQKGVKDLCDNGTTKVPNKYVLPVSDRPVIIDGLLQSKQSSLKLPFIDFNELKGPNRSDTLKALADACEQYGFFQLVNHGVPLDVTRSMIDASKRFFGLPFEERVKYMSPDLSAPVRYGTSFNQNKDDIFCWRDFFKIICNPLPEVLPHGLSFPTDLRKSADAYSKETKKLFLLLLEAILQSLELQHIVANTTEGDDATKELQDGSQILISNCYPPCPEPHLTLGIPPHSDYGFITLLLQDEIKGLQIQFQGEWVTVDPTPNSFVVIVGDHLEHNYLRDFGAGQCFETIRAKIFSNGKYKSVLHRVLTNSSRTRVTVASLHSLPFKSTVQPWPRLIDEQNPSRYKETDFAAFLDYISACEPKKKNFLESRKLT